MAGSFADDIRPSSVMDEMMALFAPPGRETRNQVAKPLHPYYKRPGKGHNHDSCDACGEGGDLICCDSCPASFHFICHCPPLEEEDIPLGEWICLKCYHKEQLRLAAANASMNIDMVGLRRMRECQGQTDAESQNGPVGGGSDSSVHQPPGKQEPAAASGGSSSNLIQPQPQPQPKSKGKGRHSKGSSKKAPVDNNKVKLYRLKYEKYLRTRPETNSPFDVLIAASQVMNAEQFKLPPELEMRENLPYSWKWSDERQDDATDTRRKICATCHRTSRGVPSIGCDYCSQVFHLDCLDPPLCEIPRERWMCPNHVEHFLDSAMVSSTRLTERLKLWQKYARAPINQESVKLEFLRKARTGKLYQASNRSRVTVPPDQRIRVPQFIKDQYRNPVPGFPAELPIPDDPFGIIAAATPHDALAGAEPVGPVVGEGTPSNSFELSSTRQGLGSLGGPSVNMTDTEKREHDEWLRQLIALQTAILKDQLASASGSTKIGSGGDSSSSATADLDEAIKKAETATSSGLKNSDKVQTEVNGPNRSKVQQASAADKAEGGPASRKAARKKVRSRKLELRCLEEQVPPEMTNGVASSDHEMEPPEEHGDRKNVNKAHTKPIAQEKSGSEPHSYKSQGEARCVKVVADDVASAAAAASSSLSSSSYSTASECSLGLRSDPEDDEDEDDDAQEESAGRCISETAQSEICEYLARRRKHRGELPDVDQLDPVIKDFLAFQRLKELFGGQTAATKYDLLSGTLEVASQTETEGRPKNGSGQSREGEAAEKSAVKPRGSHVVQTRAALLPLNNPRCKEPCLIQRRCLDVGVGSGAAIDLSRLGHCNYVSARHARIFYDQFSRVYELINYSEHGTVVDNIIYSLDVIPSWAEDNGGSAASATSSTLSLGVTKKSSLSTKKGLANLKKMSADTYVSLAEAGVGSVNEVGCSQAPLRHCRCTRSPAKFLGAERGCESSAVLRHGSYVRFGCLQFVFSIINYAADTQLSAAHISKTPPGPDRKVVKDEAAPPEQLVPVNNDDKEAMEIKDDPTTHLPSESGSEEQPFAVPHANPDATTKPGEAVENSKPIIISEEGAKSENIPDLSQEQDPEVKGESLPGEDDEQSKTIVNEEKVEDKDKS